MDGKIPLKLQVAIRDIWDKEDGGVQVARKKLADALGCTVRVQPEWLQLLAALDPLYAADRQGLAAAVAGSVELWCQVAAELVEAADGTDSLKRWAEALMDHLQPATGLRLFVDVAAEAGTAWSTECGGFVLYLPRGGGSKAAATTSPVSVSSGELAAVYRGGLLRSFLADAQKETGGPAQRPGGGGDDWADVEMDRATGTAAVVNEQQQQQQQHKSSATRSGSTTVAAAAAAAAAAATPKSEYLPSVESLPRPDDLFLRPPYHLIVSDYGNKKIEVQGSHSPSLRLLGEYLKRWCRINHGDTRSPPAVEVTYAQSCWGTSTMYDEVRLSTEGNHVFKINPAIVLAFVEGVLGYDRVSVDQGVWTYRRDVPFKG